MFDSAKKKLFRSYSRTTSWPWRHELWDETSDLTNNNAACCHFLFTYLCQSCLNIFLFCLFGFLCFQCVLCYQTSHGFIFSCFKWLLSDQLPWMLCNTPVVHLLMNTPVIHHQSSIPVYISSMVISRPATSLLDFFIFNTFDSKIK